MESDMPTIVSFFAMTGTLELYFNSKKVSLDRAAIFMSLNARFD